MINLTENALNKIKKLSEKTDKRDLALKVIVKGDCCSDKLITLTINSPTETLSEKVFHIQGLKIAVNKKSYARIKERTIDYSTDLLARGFRLLKQVNNPGCNNCK